MKRYIDKSALVAEIERYISNYKRILNKVDKSSYNWLDSVMSLESKIDVLQHLLSFLDTLEVKEVDLEDDVDKILEENDWNFDKIDFYQFAKHFFELGFNKVQKGE